MELKNRLQRMFLIIERLRFVKYSTFQDINNYIRRGFEIRDGEQEITIRTFQRDIKHIDDIFNVKIKCNKSNNYYIAETEDGFNNRMLESFDVFNMLNLGEQTSPYVLFEKRCNLGTQHLFGLLHAIKHKQVISLIHQSYHKAEHSSREAEPFALKEFKGRWYLLARDLKDTYLKTFALDRILEFDTTRKKFEFPADFNGNAYFEYCYGIIVPDDEDIDPEEIVLSFTKEQGKYILSYPLHETQQLISENENELRVKLFLFITYDFVKDLLSFGDKVRVIQPQSLIDQMNQIYSSAQKQYSLK